MAADVLNDWIGYLDRSYEQIKTSVLNRVKNANPEMTDHSESNIFVIIVSIFAAMTEMLGYYVDNIAQEAFLGVAQRNSSIINHTYALDYRIRARSAESVDVTITWTDGAGTPRNTLSAFTLAEGSSVEDADGKVYRTTQDYSIDSGIASSVIPFSQIVQFTLQDLGDTDGSTNQEVSLGTNYVHNSAQVTINSQSYVLVETFANSGPEDYHFMVNIKDDNNAYLVFGDGINGIIPPASFDILVTYKTTDGPDGRVQAGTLNTNVTLLGLPADHNGTTNNALNSSGGDDYEDAESIRKNAPRSIRTIDRMVTWEDHEEIINMVAGIAKTKVNYCCGKTIDIYIVPTGGGIASSSLVATAQAEADLKKMVATFPAVQAAGETPLIIGASVTAKPRKGITETKTAVENALVEFGSTENQEVNGSVRLSDLNALIDNLPEVDFVNITSLYTSPYARISSGNNTLVWENLTLQASSDIVTYKLIYNSAGPDLSFFISNAFITTIPLDTEYVVPDSTFKFTIDSAGTYTNGDEWEFQVYPFLKDLLIEDFTIPVIRQSDLGITVFEGNEFSSRDPKC